MSRGRPGSMGTASVPPGWYADPWQRAALRHWSGRAWEPWASDGRAVWPDDPLARRALQPQDADALRVVGEVLLPEAQARGILAPGQSPRLLDLVRLLTAEAAQLTAGEPTELRGPAVAMTQTPQPTQARAQAAGGRTSLPRSAPVGVPVAEPTAWREAFPAPRPGATAASRPPSALALWAGRARVAVGSDLAVHGLAYLGVLLLFTGLFGLVAFAFADVTPGLRPVAELAGAVVPFIAARFLLRNGAEVVGRSLEVVGGLLVAVMVVTSLLDDVPVPPDPEGAALRASLVILCLVGAGGYAVWSRRHPDSGLRYLVGPMTWFAAAMAAMGVGRPIPSGEAVAVPSSAQLSAMAVALVLTLLAARRWPRDRLAGATTTASIPGVVVLAVLTGLTWAADGWPLGPVAVTGVVLLVALLLLAPRVPAAVVGVGAPLWWALVALALLPSLPLPAVASLAAAGFLALLEIASLRQRAGAALALPGAGLLVSALLVVDDPAWAAPTWAVLLAWAAVRRMRPFVPAAQPALDLGAAGLPAAVAVAVGQVTTFGPGVAVAALLVAGATVPARGRVLSRGADDRFWRQWWWIALPVTAVIAEVGWASVDVPERWLVAGALGVLAVSALLGPIASMWRPWAVAALGTTCWVMAGSAAELPGAVRSVVPAVAALAMIVAAPRRRAGGAELAALGLAGHVLAVVTIGLAGTGWDRVATMALATTGLVWTAWHDDQERSPVAAAIAGVAPQARPLPWALALVGLPWTIWLALGLGSTPLTSSQPWVATGLLAAFGLLYAAGAHLPGPSLRAGTFAWAGFIGAVLALVVAEGQWSLIVGLAAVIASVLALPPARRAAPMRWAAWVAVAPLAGLLARRLVPWVAELPSVTAAAGTLVVVGGVMAVGVVTRDTLSPAGPHAQGRAASRASDDQLDVPAPRWVPRHSLRRPDLTAALVVAGADVLAGLALTPGAPVLHGSLLLVVVAVVVLAVGVLARAGLLGGIAVVLAWTGAWAMARDVTQVGPWLGVVVAAGLLGAAEALHRLDDHRWWSRWDVPVLVAAAPVAVTALLGALDGRPLVGTFVATGLMAVGVALRLHRRPVVAEVVGWSGTVLVLVGASDQGSGWLALALVVLAAAHTGLAVRAHGDVRTARQLIGVVASVGAWFAALSWFAWSTQQSVDVTAVVGGAVALGAAAAARTRVDRSWTAVWGAAAVLVVAGATVASLLSDGGAALDATPSLWVVLGLAAAATTLLVSAAPLLIPALRHVGMVPALAAVLVAFRAVAATPQTQVTVLSVLAASLAVVTLAVAARRPGGVWVAPSAELGGAASVVAVVLATMPEVDLALLAPAVAAAAVQAAAAGVTLRALGLQVLAVCLACASWIAFMAGSAADGPYRYTVAIGLALLAVVGLWRRDLRERSQDVAPPEVVSIEMLAVAFLVGAPFVLAVTQSILHALIAVGLGLAVVAWGAVTRVRRRVAAGAVVVLTALVVLVAVPLVALLPAWGGAGLWLLIAAVGLVAVLIATFVERGRTVARSALARVGRATSDWE